MALRSTELVRLRAPGPELSLARPALRVLARLGCVAAVTAATLWLRWPSIEIDPLRNEEVADTAYGADLLRHGRVPMIASAETRAPGASFLVRGIWGLGGRSLRVLQKASIAWSVLAALGVLALGALLFGLPGGSLAALVYAVGAPPLDGMTPGHLSWMLTPYIWSGVLFALGLRRASPWLVAGGGALVALAAFIKHQAILVVPAYVLVLALGPRLARYRGWPAVQRRWLWFFAGGMAAFFVPLAVYYLAHGGLGAFFQQYVFNAEGWRYAWGTGALDDKLPRIKDGMKGLWVLAALPALLGAMGLAGLPVRRRGAWSPVGVILAGATLAGLVGGSLGWRYLPASYLQMLPVLALAAGHPDGPMLRWRGDSPAWTNRWEAGCRVALIVALILALLPAVLTQALQLKKDREAGSTVSGEELALRGLGAAIQDSTPPSATIWAWGWPARAVYTYADRRSATRYYHASAFLADPPANTWRRPAPVRFARRGPFREIAAELARGKPTFIVVSRKASYGGWRELGDLLKKHYRREVSLDTAQTYSFIRNGLKLKKPVRPLRAP
jgi:hypothetical protein